MDAIVLSVLGAVLFVGCVMFALGDAPLKIRRGKR